MSQAGLRPSGLLLAVLVHAVLLVVLWLGMDWKSPPPKVVEAQLWRGLPPPPPPSSKPVPAEAKPTSKPEPKPVEAPEPQAQTPTPKPRAQVNLPKPEQAASEPKPRKPVEKPVEKPAQPKPEKPQKPDRQHQQMVDEAQRQAEAEAKERAKAEAEAKARADQAAAQAAGLKRDRDAYLGRMEQLIKQRIVAKDTWPRLSARFEFRLLPSLDVVAIRLVQSSGNDEYDKAVETALKLQNRFEAPPDSLRNELIGKTQTITFRWPE